MVIQPHSVCWRPKCGSKAPKLFPNGLLCSLPSLATSTYRGWDSTRERTATWATAPEPQDQKGASSLPRFVDQALLDKEAIESLLLQLPAGREGWLFFRGFLVGFSLRVAMTAKHRHADGCGLEAFDTQPQLCVGESLWKAVKVSFCPIDLFRFPKNGNLPLSLKTLFFF